MICQYCQAPVNLEPALYDLNRDFNRYKCLPCFVYFDYTKNDEHLFRAYFYFYLGVNQFILRLEYDKNYCEAYTAHGGLTDLFKMFVIPDWTPANVAEKIKKILPYI